MSIFKNIDIKLEEISKKLGAKLTIDRPGYPKALRTFEERRIDWIENEINRAIIIQPTFENSGVNSSIWNFLIIAWVKKNGIAQKPGWKKELVSKKKFETIEENIDRLLNESIENLQAIKIENIIREQIP